MQTLGTAITRRALGASTVAGSAMGLRGLSHVAAQEATPTPVQQTLDVVYGEVKGTPLLLDVF